MQEHPVRRHAYLSANSLRLRQDDSFYGFARRNIAFFVAGLVLFLLVVTIGWHYLTSNDTPYAQATVSQGDFSFSAKYYKNAVVQKSRGMNYLVRTTGGKETSLWVAKVDAIKSCSTNPTFDFSPMPDVHVENSCYRQDRLVFVADITVGNQVYQINMTAQDPINIQDAKDIFGSVTIN